MDRSIKLLAALVLSALFVRADTTFYDTVVWDFGSSLTVKPGINVTFMPGSTVDATGATLVGFPGGTGASSFLGLTDTPSSYAGQGGKVVAVKTDLTGLEFIAVTGGSGGTVTNFSSGGLAPLFTTGVTNPTTIPALAFTLSVAGAHTFLGNETGVAAAPHYVQPNFTDLAGDFALTQTPSLTASTLIGRGSTSAGDWQAITVGSGLTMTGSTLSAAAGNVSNSGTPVIDQTAVWVDATHVKGVTSVKGGTAGQVLKKVDGTDYNWVWAADQVGSGGGVGAFTDLTDVPPSYVGSAGKFVAVNGTANGLEFVPAPSGGGGVTSVFGRTGVVTALVGDYTAFYQPLDTDLTSIAALTTTTFGRGFLTLADATSSRAYIGAGTSNFDGTFTSLTGKPTTISGYGITDAQPLDADLTALGALTGLNTIYYRSAANTWSAVTPGSNMTFGSGTLNAANSNWDTAYTDRMKWDGGSTGLVAATGRTSLGLDIGVNVQAFDADLTSLAAASSTNAIYYRSAASTWSPVTIGSGLTFGSGTLTAIGSGDVSSNTTVAVDGEAVVFNTTTGKNVRRAVGSGIATLASGVLGTTSNNSGNWDTAYTDRMKWDTSLGISGGTTGQGRTALGATTAGSNLFTLANPAAISWLKIGTTGTVTAEDAATTRTSLGLSQPGGNNNTVQYKTASGVFGGIANTSTDGTELTITSNAPGRTRFLLKNTNATSKSSEMSWMNAAGTELWQIGNDSTTNGTQDFYVYDDIGGAFRLLIRSNGVVDAPYGFQVGSAPAAGLILQSNGTAFVPTALTNPGVVTGIAASGGPITFTYGTPAGCRALYVECLGGGGGGGGWRCTSGAGIGGGSGGGGGGYAASYITSPAASYSVTVGGGGTAASAATGGPGGTTSFGAVVSATGGAGGTGLDGTCANAPANGYPGAVGGAGTAGQVLIRGGDGSTATWLGGSGATAQVVAGRGGCSVFGGETQAPQNTCAHGNPGALYGGGGSGGVSSACAPLQGGVGASGLIRIWAFY